MLVDAIVLAGAPNTGKLQMCSDAAYEAEIDINGRTMVDYVLIALRQSSHIGRIMLVGPAQLREQISAPDVELALAGESMIENISIGIEQLQPKGKVLLITSDIPMITAAAIDDFLQLCSAHSADIYYPVVTREANEHKYPGVHRTYVHVTEGVFTGGNLVLLEPAVLYQGYKVLAQAIDMRKKPWQLARLLGPSFLCKLMAKKLSIKEIEQQVSVALGYQGRAIFSSYPEIGIDVDKPSDLDIARRELARCRK